MNWEEEIRKIVDATYEDGRMVVARVDTCNIAVKQLLDLIGKSKQEGIRTVVGWIKENAMVVSSYRMGGGLPVALHFGRDKWQSFLKEQGVGE